LVGRYRQNRRAIAAICLNADSTALTCIGNDYGFDKIFSRQIEALGQPGDVLVLFTTSGNSENLIQAAQAARLRDVKVVGFVGRPESRLAPHCDAQWIVSSTEGARIQEMHTWAMHVIIEMIEGRLFPELSSQSV
jgi:D-sedoheptulose 7-phosphate isomerase